METLYIKINIRQSDKETDIIRNAGLFFSNIANAISIDRDRIVEIDETNYLSEAKNIKKKFSYD